MIPLGYGMAYFRWHALVGYFNVCKGWHDGRMCRGHWLRLNPHPGAACS